MTAVMPQQRDEDIYARLPAQPSWNPPTLTMIAARRGTRHIGEPTDGRITK